MVHPSPIARELQAEELAGLAHRRMFDDVEVFDGEAVLAVLRRDGEDRSYLKRLRDRDRVIGLGYGRKFVYPAFPPVAPGR